MLKKLSMLMRKMVVMMLSISTILSMSAFAENVNDVSEKSQVAELAETYTGFCNSDTEFYELESAYIELSNYAYNCDLTLDVSLDLFLLNYDETYISVEAYTDHYLNNLSDYCVLATASTDANMYFDNDSAALSSGGSSWYYNTGTSLPQSASYASYGFLSLPIVGDIIIEQDTITGWSGHAAMVEGRFWSSTYSQYYVRLIESVQAGVCRGVISDTRISDKDSRLYRVTSATALQRAAALTFVRNQLGEGWSLKAGKTNDTNAIIWYCSELVWAAYYNQGFDLSGGTSGVITPYALESSSLLTTIFDPR